MLTYDDVMNQQRTIIYKQRQTVLNGDDISETILNMIRSTIAEDVEMNTRSENVSDWNFDAIRTKYMGLLCREDDFRFEENEMKRISPEAITDMLYSRALEIYREKEAIFGAEKFREIERSVLLKNVDRMWMEHIDAMDDLKGSVGLQAYAQRDPVNEYRILGADMFDAMVSDIREQTVRIMLSIVPIDEAKTIRRVQVGKPMVEGFGSGKTTIKKVSVTESSQSTKSPDRNAPCPCGSGKKYKKCCGAASINNEGE